MRDADGVGIPPHFTITRALASRSNKMVLYSKGLAAPHYLEIYTREFDSGRKVQYRTELTTKDWKRVAQHLCLKYTVYRHPQLLQFVQEEDASSTIDKAVMLTGGADA